MLGLKRQKEILILGKLSYIITALGMTSFRCNNLFIRPVSVPAFLAILLSHGRKSKGSYSQLSSSQCPKRAK